jgi:hypothetical protein
MAYFLQYAYSANMYGRRPTVLGGATVLATGSILRYIGIG